MNMSTTNNTTTAIASNGIGSRAIFVTFSLATVLVLLLLVPSPTNAFVATRTTTPATRSSSSRRSSSSSIRTPFFRSSSSSSLALRMSLKPTYESLCTKVVEKLGLKETDFTETFEGKTWACSVTGATGSAEWMDEASPKFLTGVTMATQQDKTNGEQLTLNIWMGPSYDVPHMLLTFGEQAGGEESSSGKYAVTADYVVRGATPIGSDPRYLETFYGEDVVAAWTEACALDGAAELADTTKSLAARVSHSPVRFSVGNLAKENAESVASNHLERFLGWIDEAQPIPARLRGSMNLRDDKLRQYFYQGQVQTNTAALGGDGNDDIGRIVAAVNTGPT